MDIRAKTKYLKAYLWDIENIPTGVLQAIYTFLALGVWGIGISLDRKPITHPDLIGLMVLSLSFFLGGLPGIIFIHRKEAPIGFGVIIHERKAVLYGILYTLIPWSLAIYGIIQAIVKLFV
jgi:hypothetical protein